MTTPDAMALGNDPQDVSLARGRQYPPQRAGPG